MLRSALHYVPHASDNWTAPGVPVALAGWLDKLRAAEAGLVVLDTGRDANNAGYIAARAADLILIPLRPGGFDLLALGPTLDLCKLAGKRPYVVLNAIRPGSTRAEADAPEALADLECELVAPQNPQTPHQGEGDAEMKSSLKNLAREIEPEAKAPARPATPVEAPSYPTAQTREGTRQLSGHYPAEDVQAFRILAGEQDKDCRSF